MFDKPYEALKFISGKNENSECRKHAVDKIIEDPACCFLFIKNCKWTIEERKAALKPILENQQLTYMLFTNCRMTTKETMECLDVLTSSQYLEVLLSGNRLTQMELDMVLESIVKNQNEKAANIFLRYTNDSKHIDRLHSLILAKKMCE